MDDDCPVALGKKPQSFDCEECDWEKNDPIYQLVAKLESHIRFLLSFAPKSCPRGLDATFYHTLSYKGDVELQQKIDAIRAELEEDKS